MIVKFLVCPYSSEVHSGVPVVIVSRDRNFFRSSGCRDVSILGPLDANIFTRRNKGSGNWLSSAGRRCAWQRTTVPAVFLLHPAGPGRQSHANMFCATFHEARSLIRAPGTPRQLIAICYACSRNGHRQATALYSDLLFLG